MLKAQERYVEAEPLFERIVQIRTKAFGPKSPATQQALTDVAKLRQSMTAKPAAKAPAPSTPSK